jgi:CRISPR/Cas system CSM-associated protein Csm3 (group 7 of RAMP superfamily)
MSTQIDYQIQFYSEWHCGSGLSAGADTDALVLKDKDGLPYIPGKTLKGLLREAAEEIQSISKQPSDIISQAFGRFDEKDSFSQGTLFFTNATLNESERKTIIKEGLKPFLYSRVASTAIDDNGIARDGSLRSMETVLPCTLEGSIRGVEDDEYLISLLEKAMHYVKCLGVNRNRGLGRCDIKIKKEGGEK